MTMNVDDFTKLLLEVAEVVNGERFQVAIDEFCTQHDDAFAVGDKESGEGYTLQQTEAHKKYEEMVDKLLTDQLRSGFPMEEVFLGLERHLKTLIDKREENSEMGKAADAINILMSFTDFVTFHDMMVGHRMKKLYPEGGDNTTRRITSTVDTGMVKIQEFLDMTSSLCAEGATTGWVIACDTNQYKVLTKLVDGKKLMKVNMIMEGDMELGLDMWMNWTEERKNWDPSVNDIGVDKNLLDDEKRAAGILQDEIVKLALVMPAAIKWMMGFPDILYFRVATQRSADGVYSYVTVTWDIEKDAPIEGKLEIKKLGTLKQIDATHYNVSALQYSSTWIPDWALGAMMKTFVVGRMQAMVESHRKYREKVPLRK